MTRKLPKRHNIKDEEEEDNGGLFDSIRCYYRIDLIERLCRETGLKKEDCARIFELIEGYLVDVIHEGAMLRWYGIFTMYITQREGYKGWDGIHKKKYDIPTRNRIIFRPGSRLTESARLLQAPLEVLEEKGIEVGVSKFDKE